MRTRFRKHLAAFAAVAAIGGGLATAPTAGATEQAAPQSDEISASNCLGGANKYSKAKDFHWLPPGLYFKTSSRCNDIQIKPKTNRYVSVCFKDPATGCRGAKLAKAGKWTVLASNVKTGSEYQFFFRSLAKSSGEYAH